LAVNVLVVVCGCSEKKKKNRAYFEVVCTKVQLNPLNPVPVLLVKSLVQMIVNGRWKENLGIGYVGCATEWPGRRPSPIR
jgi:hypothetical protein